MLVTAIQLKKSFPPSHLFSFPLAPLKKPKAATDEGDGVLRRGEAADRSSFPLPLQTSKPGAKLNCERKEVLNGIRVEFGIITLAWALITKNRLFLPETKHKTIKST